MRRAMLVLCCCAVARAESGADYQRGTVALVHQLSRLQTTARVLHVAAHPDDEDSALLALLARGYGARVGYLSLTRGEGGQNSLGPELYDALGLVRTEELLAARALDGAEQWFGGAYDFGFSKTAAETVRHWGEQETLSDIVAAIRRQRPQVVITRFAGDRGDGHGHHQVAGWLCRRAFRLAGDPRAFPEQLQQGLLPWQATKLYLDRWDVAGTAAPLDVGAWSPLYGRSYLSLAMAGRSRHRSQDMGRLEPRGPSVVRLTLLDQVGEPDASGAIFDGLDLRLVALVPEPAADAPAWQREVRAQLIEAAAAVREAQSVLVTGLLPRQTVGELARALRALRRIDETIQPLPVEAVGALRLAIGQKIADCSLALMLAAGVELDALADRRQVAPGEALTVAGQVYWPERTRVDSLRLVLQTPTGWTTSALPETPLFGNHAVSSGSGDRVDVPADAAPTQPYWLAQPRRGDRFATPDPALAGLPYAPPPLQVQLRLAIDGGILSVVRPVTWRVADPRRGERRAPVTVVPAVTASVRPDLVVLTPRRTAPVVLTTVLRNHTTAAVRGRLLLRAGDTHLAAPVEVAIAAGDRQRARLTLTAPVKAGLAQLCWQVADRPAQPLQGLHEIDYDHIRPSSHLTAATVRLVAVDAQVPTARAVGYVPGPGDDWPEALRRLGVAVRWLDAETFDEPDALEGLRTIVIGLRAYETNEALARHHRRLLDWVAAGGTLVVQHQKLPWSKGGYAPYPLTIAEPHDRVTDEAAPVRFLPPDHPLLTWPNRLGPADFDGWVQERGLYFAHQWDERYRPLLECHDPGEGEQRGGLLVAAVGQGAFVYCPLALFRQLPAGVPGAYRLLANLVAFAARPAR